MLTEDEQGRAEFKEYGDLENYRKNLIGKTIKSVFFAPDADEGLVLIMDDGWVLYFGFSGFEGHISVSPH